MNHADEGVRIDKGGIQATLRLVAAAPTHQTGVALPLEIADHWSLDLPGSFLAEAHSAIRGPLKYFALLRAPLNFIRWCADKVLRFL
jgi:hypothetical protein